VSASVGGVARPHCASEGASLFGVLKSSAFEPSASPALRIFRGVLLLSAIGALALPLMGIQDAVGRNLGIADHAIVKTIAEYGNSSTATIPLSLMLTNQAEPFRPGETAAPGGGWRRTERRSAPGSQGADQIGFAEAARIRARR